MLTKVVDKKRTKTMNIIKVQIKNIYGNDCIYPACEKSRVFVRMLNQKTLTMKDIVNIKALGFTIEQIAQPNQWIIDVNENAVHYKGV